MRSRNMTIKTFNINTDKTAFVRAYLPDSIAGLSFCEKRPAGMSTAPTARASLSRYSTSRWDTPRSWLHIAATSASQNR